MQIRSLSVYSSALPAASALAVRTLELRRSTLHELDLELLPDDPNAAKYSYGPLLAAVDAMESLDKLALGTEDCYGPTVRFQFRRLSTVRRLRLYDGLHQSTIRSLLASNRDTLREVWCGENEMAHLLAAEAPSVREVGALWKGSGKMLEPLRHLPNLDLLELRLMRFFAPWHERLARFLDSSPLAEASAIEPEQGSVLPVGQPGGAYEQGYHRQRLHRPLALGASRAPLTAPELAVRRSPRSCTARCQR